VVAAPPSPLLPYPPPLMRLGSSQTARGVPPLRVGVLALLGRLRMRPSLLWAIPPSCRRSRRFCVWFWFWGTCRAAEISNQANGCLHTSQMPGRMLKQARCNAPGTRKVARTTTARTQTHLRGERLLLLQPHSRWPRLCCSGWSLNRRIRIRLGIRFACKDVSIFDRGSSNLQACVGSKVGRLRWCNRSVLLKDLRIAYSCSWPCPGATGSTQTSACSTTSLTLR